MAFSDASISDSFRKYLYELECLAKLRRDLAYTPNTSNAPELTALISEKVKCLRYFLVEERHDQITQEEADRIIGLIITFGEGYDECGGLEYETFRGLDHIFLGFIGRWRHKAVINISDAAKLGEMRARLSVGPATSAAHQLDELIALTLQMEFEKAKVKNKARSSETAGTT